jgi:mono/diheme cytochrome c family protein
VSPLRAFCLSAAASLVALGAAFALGGELQRRARVESHELPPWPGLPVPPGATPTSLSAAGRKLFLNSCAHCHGADARGDEGPDLHALEVSDRRIATVIRGGIKGEMPSFAKKHSPEEIAALIAYLRSLG